MTIYAVGDIHGYISELEHALALIDADGRPDARVVFVGDYTDRGPHSRDVVEALRAGMAAGRNWVAIRGNHDRMFCNFVTQGTEHDARVSSGISWLNMRLGGSETLASYGLVSTGMPGFARRADGREYLTRYPVKGRNMDAQDLAAAAREAVPRAHLDFLRDRPLWHQEDGLLFVHAGLKPGIALQDQAEDDLIWIRDGWLDDPRDHGVLVVHGHTALEAPRHHGNRVNVDCGTGYGNPLVPVAFEDGRVWTLGEDGRVPLVPQ